MAPEEVDPLPAEHAKALEDWVSRLGPEANEFGELFKTTEASNGRPGWLHVYAPGSIVCSRNVQGLLNEVEIIAPELFSFDGGPPQLFYKYKHRTGVKAMVPSSQIEAVGDQWSFTYWNPTTDECVDVEDDLVTRNIERPVSLSDSLTGHEI